MEGSLLSDYIPSQRLRVNANNLLKSNGESDAENETLTELLKDERVEIVANRMRELEEQVKMIPELQVIFETVNTTSILCSQSMFIFS